MSGEAETDAKIPAETVKSLYGYLDLLDRKGASILTVNSILSAIGGAYILKYDNFVAGLSISYLHFPNFMEIVTYSPFWLTIASVALSVIGIGRLLHVFQMKWPYMERAFAADPPDFSAETGNLCCIAASRFHVVQAVWKSTFRSLLLIAAALVINIFGILQ